MDVLDDLVDLRIAETGIERWHRAHLTILDTVAKKFVVTLCIHELRPLASSATSIGMAAATSRCEQLPGVEWCIVGRRGGRQGLSQRTTCQRGGQDRRNAMVQFHFGISSFTSVEIPTCIGSCYFTITHSG